MYSLPLNLFDQQITFAMPDRLYRLVQAASMNCFDPRIGYGYAMGIIAAITQRYCRIAVGKNFETEVSLYFLAIAPSGSGKSAIFDALFKPVEECVRNKRQQVIEDNKKLRSHNIALEHLISEKRKQARRLSGSSLKILTEEIASLEMQKQPLKPEFIFNAQDITSAALLKLLSIQEDHSLLIADPEGRVLRCIDEDKALSGLLNQAFMGEAVSNFRATATGARVDNPHLSMISAIQPEKLCKLKRNPNLWGEGLMPRILPYYANPQLIGAAPIGEIMDIDIMSWWVSKISELFNMKIKRDAQGNIRPYVLTLDNDALKCFEEHAQQLQNMKSWPVNLGLQANLARMPELTARLSAIYHLLEHPSPFDFPVPGWIMQFATNASLFFLEQARRLFMDLHPDPVSNLLKRLILWLKSRIGTDSYVTVKEMYRGVGSQKSGLMQAIQILSQRGILILSCSCEPDLFNWTKVKSYGFNINFQLLATIPD